MRTMTPTPVIGISLKMYFDPERSLAWSREVADVALTHPAVTGGDLTLVVLPSLTAMADVVGVFAGTPVLVGAQDLFWEDRGPFTGAISGTDLRQLGCAYVEVGHAERRRLFGEDDRIVNLKVRAALRNGLTPLLCIGESDRTTPARAAAECVAQLRDALEDVRGDADPLPTVPLVVAYEPSWAIGEEQPADAAHVAHVAASLRDCLRATSGFEAAPLIYGGSAGPGLLTELRGAVDGLFLGRSAHEAVALTSILDEAAQLR